MRARRANRCAPEVRADLLLIEEIVSEALKDIRVIVGSLREQAASGPPVDERPLSSRVADIVARIPPDALAVSLETVGIEHEVSSSSRGAALRVVEEGLTNAIKHAHQGNAEVSLQYRGGDLAVVVRSDSARHGSSGSRGAGGGYGLIGLRERVVSCGGVFEQHTGPRGEFTVRAAFPKGDMPISAG